MDNTVNELAQNLRIYANEYRFLPNNEKDNCIKDLLLIAADTIDELSEKVTRKNKKHQMNKIYKMILDNLNKKKDELKKHQEQFLVMCGNEIQSSTFEKNAISDLLIMYDLKSEIAALEHWETLLRVQMTD